MFYTDPLAGLVQFGRDTGRGTFRLDNGALELTPQTDVHRRIHMLSVEWIKNRGMLEIRCVLPINTEYIKRDVEQLNCLLTIIRQSDARLSPLVTQRHFSISCSPFFDERNGSTSNDLGKYVDDVARQAYYYLQMIDLYCLGLSAINSFITIQSNLYGSA